MVSPDMKENIGEKISRLPALKLLLFVGIGFIILTSFNVVVASVLVFFSIVIFILSVFKKYNNTAYLSGVISISCLLFLHFSSDIIQWNKINYEEYEVLFEGEVEKVLSSNEKFLRVIASGKIDSKDLERFHSRIILNIFKNNPEDNLITDQKIYSSLRLKVPTTKQLYSDFDTRQYIKSYEVNFISSLNYRELAILSESDDYNKIISNFREYTKSIILNLYPDEQNRAIVSALVLGDKSLIDSDTKHLFSITGTAHLLALSGLHVGIISAFLFVILGFVRNKWVLFIVFTLLLSGFVIVTGASPSALRATFMAILFLFIWNLQRDAKILNIFSFVVLSMLVFNPNIILSISFQLSVLAVFSIIILYHKIYYKLLNFKKDTRKIYKVFIGSVSLALSASIGVSAVSAYYFGVFPIFAIISNIIIIPLISLSLIWSLFGMILFNFSEYLANLFSSSAGLFIDLSIWVNELISSIPMAYAEGENVFFIALISSLGFIYLLYSTNFKLFTFRFSVILFISFICLNFEDDEIIKISRKSHDVFLFENEEYSYCLSVEKKHDEYPDFDIGLYKYLDYNKKKIYVFSTGYNGINTVDNLLENNEVMRVDLDKKSLNILKDKLKLIL
jgi:competence protein ComEC